jgi:hypothetical protein
MKGKTMLKKKVIRKDEEPEPEYTKSKIIKGKTNLGKNKLRKNINKIRGQNIAKELVEQIILTYCANAWKNKVDAMKNKVSGRPNKKAKDLRTLVRVIDRTISYHTYLNLMELFDILSSLPPAKDHDPNFGKIFIVKKEQKEENEVNEENDENEEKEEYSTHEIEMDENDIVVDERPKRFRDNVPKHTNKEKKYNKNEFDEELKYYFYRNDGKPLNRVDIEKDINKLMEEFPEKDIDVERILKSKRLQYKLKHPRFSPFTKAENIDSFVRFVYTYKQQKKEDEKLNKKTKYRTYA